VAGAGTRRGAEPLRVAGRRAASHASLALAGRLVRVLRPVVQSLVPPVLDAPQDRPLRRPVARARVGEHHARHLVHRSSYVVHIPQGIRTTVTR